MSQNRSVSGGVRNLRAMFENKDDTVPPPPDRGRSPAGVIGNNSENRPLSRVRTSFIAVDNRNGYSALRKEAELNSATEASNSSNKSSPEGSPKGTPSNDSHNMSFAKRRSSFSINEEINPQAVRARRESIAEEFEARRESNAVTETIPEAAIETPSLEPNPEKQLGSFGPLPTTMRPELTKTSTPVQSASKARRPSTLETLDGSRPPIANNSSPKPRRGSMAVSDEKPNLKQDAASTATDADKAEAEKATSKAVPKSSLAAEPKASSRPAKSPVPPKTPTSPRQTTTKPANKPTSSSAADKKPSARPSAAASYKSSPPGAKPKSKSPTRPVKLPSSLMAPTAASVKKTASTPPVSKGSESKPANTTPKSGVQRKPSTLKKDAAKPAPRRSSSKPPTSRPSAGEEPKDAAKPAPRRSSSKPPTFKQSAGEESKEAKPKATTSQGFLERMMRPTAASAQKTHEKQASPPKRTTSSAKRSKEQTGHRNTGSPEQRKSKSVSPMKPRKKSLEEQEKQPHEDAVVMQALMDGNPVGEAVEELQVENEQKAEKEVKKALEKPQISSTKPVQAPVEPPVDPESSGPTIPPTTSAYPIIADSPLKTEVKVSDESKSGDKPADPFQAMKETPSMSAARKGPPSTGEGNALKPSLLEAFESGSAIADDDEEDLPMPIPHPHKSSTQEPEEESIPEDTAGETKGDSFNKLAVEKEISEQTKAETEKLNAEEVKPAPEPEQPKAQKPKAVQQLKAEEETVDQLARKESAAVEAEKENVAAFEA